MSKKMIKAAIVSAFALVCGMTSSAQTLIRDANETKTARRTLARAGVVLNDITTIDNAEKYLTVMPMLRADSNLLKGQEMVALGMANNLANNTHYYFLLSDKAKDGKIDMADINYVIEERGSGRNPDKDRILKVTDMKDGSIFGLSYSGETHEWKRVTLADGVRPSHIKSFMPK